MTDADRLVRDLSAGLAKDSIVTQALARFLEQVIREIHETRIAPAEARALAAEAALAKAGEALEPFDDMLGENEPYLPDNEPVTVKYGPCTDYSLTLGDLRRVRTAIRARTNGESP